MTPEQMKLIEQQFRLPEIIARSYLRKGVHPRCYYELVEVGRLGLVEAADRYDLTKGASFKTYATYRVRGRILDYLRDQIAYESFIQNDKSNRSRSVKPRKPLHPKRRPNLIIDVSAFQRGILANGGPVLW